MQQYKANIERADISDHPAVNVIQGDLAAAGSACKPAGFNYLASFAVHLYRASLADNNYAFVTQLHGLSDIDEAHADVALKELRRSLMEKYGRKPEKERK